MSARTPDHGALDHFVAKWQRREPEMALAEPFCPSAERLRFRAWGALVHELREAVFELSDPAVTAAKSRWWAEELLALADGQGRHPLAAALQEAAVPWPALASAVLATATAEAGRPGDTAAALAQLRPLAEALANAEAALFGAEVGDAGAVAVHLLLHRLPEGLGAEDQARLPLHLLARHGLDASAVAAGRGGALLRDWGRELQAVLPSPKPGQALFRRLRTGFDRARLGRLARGPRFDAPAALPTVLRAWRLARAR
ncbi:hypothetical protein [Arenimonas fontis]|uniref:Phytoene synthase n=1 Tax=Arenimonas fontis TaxID=2608255 RepID=A0A5B2ZEN6_9GAMM|nr:hypothetical protein [Arenimonas fontis]KAA2285491.1 hypothetical protein F0415_02300 [Arenimonas fontis]